MMVRADRKFASTRTGANSVRTNLASIAEDPPISDAINETVSAFLANGQPTRCHIAVFTPQLVLTQHTYVQYVASHNTSSHLTWMSLPRSHAARPHMHPSQWSMARPCVPHLRGFTQHVLTPHLDVPPTVARSTSSHAPLSMVNGKTLLIPHQWISVV
jgi:hypothetical protein